MIAALPPCPTKDQERAHLAAFLATVHPTSYLADYLDGVEEEFSRAIAVDICFPRNDTLRSLTEEHRRAESELSQTRRAIESARQELRTLTAACETTQRRLTALADEADTITHRARNAASK